MNVNTDLSYLGREKMLLHIHFNQYVAIPSMSPHWGAKYYYVRILTILNWQLRVLGDLATQDAPVMAPLLPRTCTGMGNMGVSSGGQKGETCHSPLFAPPPFTKGWMIQTYFKNVIKCFKSHFKFQPSSQLQRILKAFKRFILSN